MHVGVVISGEHLTRFALAARRTVTFNAAHRVADEAVTFGEQHAAAPAVVAAALLVQLGDHVVLVDEAVAWPSSARQVKLHALSAVVPE